MNIKSLMDKKGNQCHSITPDVTMSAAVDKMMQHRIGSLVIVDEANNPISIITERDVMFTIHHHGCDIKTTKVSEIMGPKLVTCDVADSIKDAMALMFNNDTGRRVRHLPVMDGDKLIGMVSNGDLLGRIVEETEFENRVMKNYIQNWPEEDVSESTTTR